MPLNYAHMGAFTEIVYLIVSGLSADEFSSKSHEVFEEITGTKENSCIRCEVSLGRQIRR